MTCAKLEIKEGWERSSGKSVGNPAMDKSLVVIIICPLLTLSSAASWGYRDLTLADHEFFLIPKFNDKKCTLL